MAIAFDAASEAEDYGIVHNWAHVVGVLTDRVLLVAVSFVGVGQSVSTITYAGQSLTLLATEERTTEVRLELWYLKSPPSGENNIVVTRSDTSRCTFGAASWAGVDQAVTFGTKAKARSYGSTVTLNVTSEEDEVVIDAIGWKGDVVATVDVSQDERWNRLGNPGAIKQGCAGSSEDGATTVTMSWGLAGDANWCTIGVPLKPVAAQVKRGAACGFMFIEDADQLRELGSKDRV